MVHLEKVPDSPLWRLSIFLDGCALGKHTLLQGDLGPVLLSSLAHAMETYVGDASAIRGALAWSPYLPVPTKQESRQLLGWAATVWRFVRAFLP